MNLNLFRPKLRPNFFHSVFPSAELVASPPKVTTMQETPSVVPATSGHTVPVVYQTWMPPPSSASLHLLAHAHWIGPTFQTTPVLPVKSAPEKCTQISPCTTKPATKTASTCSKTVAPHSAASRQTSATPRMRTSEPNKLSDKNPTTPTQKKHSTKHSKTQHHSLYLFYFLHAVFWRVVTWKTFELFGATYAIALIGVSNLISCCNLGKLAGQITSIDPRGRSGTGLIGSGFA